MIAQFTQETCRNEIEIPAKHDANANRPIWSLDQFADDIDRCQTAISKRLINEESSLKPWKVLRECSKNDHLVQAIICQYLSSCLPPVYQFDNSFIIRPLFGKHCLEDRFIELLSRNFYALNRTGQQTVVNIGQPGGNQMLYIVKDSSVETGQDSVLGYYHCKTVRQFTIDV